MSDLRSDQRVVELVRRLRTALDPCTIYLFGSQATGQARSDSDMDVLVIVDSTQESHYEHRKRAHAALLGFGHPVDMLIYTRDEWNELAPKRYSVARQVRDTGVVLHAAA